MAEMKPFLTVIVPIGKLEGRFHNLETWLIDASVRNIRVILVHDDKKDSTGVELQRVTKSLNCRNITLISGEFKGPGTARNQGLKLVDTDWFAFWDSDDLPRVQEFISMVLQAQSEGKKVAQGQFSIVHESSREIMKFSKQSDRNWNVETARYPGLWRFAFSTQEFGENTFPEISMGEDQVYLAKLDLDKEEILIWNKVVYDYFVGSNSQLTKSDSLIEDLEKARLEIGSLIKSGQAKNTQLLRLMLMKQQITLVKRKISLRKSVGALSFLSKLICKNFVQSSSEFRQLFFTGDSMVMPNMTYLQGGLGNQLFQVGALVTFSDGNPCIAMANSVGKKDKPSAQKLMEISSADVGVHYKECHFSKIKVKFLNYSLRVSSKFSHDNTKLQNALLLVIKSLLEVSFRLLDSERELRISRGVGFDSNLEHEKSNIFYVGYFQSEYYAKSLREKLTGSISDLLGSNDGFESARKYAADKRILVLQVRLGDYSENPEFGSLSVEYFKNTLKLAAARNDYVDFWLFSNEAEKAMEMIGNGEWAVFRDMSRDGLSDYEVLALMSLGSAFVISNSTFGWWGAYLSAEGDENNEVFYPRPWFEKLPNPEMLTPNAWFPVPAFDLQRIN